MRNLITKFSLSILVLLMALLGSFNSPASAQSFSGSSCLSLSSNVRYTSRGDAVVSVQNFLIAQGFLSAGNSTGYFGRLTLAAVKNFQSSNGIDNTGFVGPLTRAKIREVSCGGAGNGIGVGTGQISFCPLGQQYNPIVGSCVGGSGNSGGRLDLVSSVIYSNSSGTSVDYTINDYANSAAYYVNAICPSGVSASLNGTNICSGLSIPSSQRRFSVFISNDASYSQSVTVRVRSYDMYSNITGEDSETVSTASSPRTYINVSSPNANTSYTQGGVMNIRWTSAGVSEYSLIEVRKDNTAYDTIASSAFNTGSYTWILPENYPLGSNYKIRVYDVNRSDVYGESENVFSVVQSVNTQKSITSFVLANVNNSAVIDDANKTVTVTVPAGTVIGNFTPTITISGKGSISPASGVVRNFGTPKDYVVTAGDGSTQTYRVTVVAGPKSSAKSVTSFRFGSLNVDGVINESASPKTIAVTVPFSASVTSLAPTIAVSSGATIVPASGVAQNFTSPKTYTVTAPDGSTQTYTVTVNRGAASSAKAITAFSIASLGVTGSINESASPKAVTVSVPFGTPVTSLAPTVTVSAGAAVSPVSGTVRNFTSPLVYTVTAQDGTTQNYTVTVTQADGSAEKTITSFRFANPSIAGVINESASPKTIVVTVPFGTATTSLSAVIGLSSSAATVSPAATTLRNFSLGPLDYIVTAQNGTSQTYKVSVVVSPATSAKVITDFRFANPAAVGTINEANHTIAVNVPFGTNLATLTPTITSSANSTVAPIAGSAAGFASPKTYRVTAQNGSFQDYVVTVTPASGSPLKAISSFTFTNPNVEGVINESAKTITIHVPFGTSISSRAANISISPNAKVSPASGALVAFTSNVAKTYTVTAQNGDTQEYAVTVIVDGKSSLKTISSFRFNSLNLEGVINESVSPKSITFTVPAGTTRTLTPTIVISPYASISPGSGISQTFNPYKDYRVTAQDGTYNDYRVYVNN